MYNYVSMRMSMYALYVWACVLGNVCGRVYGHVCQCEGIKVRGLIGVATTLLTDAAMAKCGP